jgi:hypothetical protein
MIAEFRRDFGEELGERLYYAYEDWQRTALLWEEIQALVRTNERLRLMEDVADRALQAILSCLIDSVVLRLCKLTDIAQKGKNKNVTIQCVAGIGEKLSLPLLDKKVQDAVNSAEKLTVLRNKVIAHSDWEYLRLRKKGDVTIVGLVEVAESIDKIFEIFRYIFELKNRSQLMREVSAPGGGVEALLYVVARGEIARDRICSSPSSWDQSLEEEIRKILR